MIACFLSNISAKYYKNPSMLSRVIAKKVGDVFLRHSVVVQINAKIYECMKRRNIFKKHQIVYVYDYEAPHRDICIAHRHY